MSYKAIVCKIEQIKPITGADRIVCATVVGNEVVVSIQTKEGDLGVFFPEDGIFNDQFCEENRLFPVLDENGKKIGGGFFERGKSRIRAQRFKSVKSCGFWCPLDYLKYTGYDLSKLKAGDQFDELNGIKICEKYYTPATLRAQANSKKYGKKMPVCNMLAEHQDTERFIYKVSDIPKGALISFQNKRHGTSFRAIYGYQTLELNKFQKLVNKFYPIFPDKKREYLIGTRRVVLLPEDENKEGFHGSEAFRYKILPLIRGKIPFGYTLYGEITGWANNKPIMPPHILDKSEYKEVKNLYNSPMYFSYGDIEGEMSFALYHVTFTNEDGYSIDLSWEEVKRLAQKVGIKHTLELEPEFVYDGDKDKLIERVKSYLDKPDPEDSRHYSEGVIIRYTVGNQTKFLKEKGYYFKLGEGIIKSDDTQVDMEESA